MYLVIGGNGLVGSYLITELLRQGLPTKCTLRTEQAKQDLLDTILIIGGLEMKERMHLLEFAFGDIRDFLFLEDLMDKNTIVLHTAATVSFDPRDKQMLFDVNIDGTTNVVNACLYKNVKKLVYTSSVAAIVSAEGSQAIDENTNWQEDKKNTNYALSKRFAEYEVWRGIEEGLNGCIVNPTIILGYTKNGNSSSSIFHNIKNGFPFYSNGINGFVGAVDVAKIIVRIANSDIAEQRFVLNAGNTSYKELFKQIAKQLGKREPRIEVKHWMKWITLPIAWLWSKISGKPPFVTKEVFV